MGGTVVLKAPSIPSAPAIQATGHNGGAVRVEATAGAIGGYDIDVSGRSLHGTGGKVCLTAPAISLGYGIDARGADHGGTIVMQATTGILGLTTADFDASGATGGTFQATASGDIHLDFASIDVHRNGCIGLTGRNVFTARGRFSDPIQPTCGVTCLP